MFAVAQSGPIVARPSAFVQSSGKGMGLNFSSSSYGNAVLDFNNMPFEDLRDNFGMLLGKPKNGICSQATTVDEFMCHMDVFTAYKAREWPIFSTWMTAQLLNANNRTLTGIISPILETPEVNFTVSQTSISAMPFTEIAPCGIPEEPSGHYTYSWKQTVRQYEQGCTIQRDLVLDPNFGAQIWLQTLASFVAGARLTIDMGIITTLVQMGYENMVRSKTEGCPIDVFKLFAKESESFLIMAISPQQGFVVVRNLEQDIPGLDTLIIPQGKSAYLRDVQGDSLSMMVQNLSTDPVTGRLMVAFAEGPDSYKTIKLGENAIQVIEFTPFFIGNPGIDGRGAVRVNPLKTNVTVGQFYPPSPLIKIDGGCVRAACADIHNIGIFYQTKTTGRIEMITLQKRLENSLYWDPKTGKVSRLAYDFARSQSQARITDDALPWDWNPQNPEYDHAANINRESTSNSEPNLADVSCQTDLWAMKSWRNEFVGITFNPRTNQFVVPRRFGDFHLRSIPNAWIKLGSDQLIAKASEYLGFSVEKGFMNLRKLASAIRHSSYTDEYLFALLNKNLPNMISITEGPGGPVYRLIPERTPLERPDKSRSSNKSARDQCKFPDTDVIDEVKSNRYGGWDLPEKTGTMLQTYPPGFANGVGLITLAQEALKDGTTMWRQAGVEAAEAVSFANEFLKFVREFIGKTDLINARLMAPWIHKPSALAMLIDSIVRAAGPVHVGAPDTINFVANGPVTGVTTQKVNLTLDTVLLETVEATRAALESAVAIGAPRAKINNETRAYACLSNDVYRKMRGLGVGGLSIDAVIDALGGDDQFRADLFALLHQLYDYVVALCGVGKSAAAHQQNVIIATLVTDAFYEQLRGFLPGLAAATLTTEEARDSFRRDTIIRAMKTFSTNFKNASGMKKFIAIEKEKKSPIECVNYGEGFVEALRRYEQEPRGGRPVLVTQGPGVLPLGADLLPPVYRADYSLAPAKFLRAPLASSQSLRDYLRNKLNPWILPSDSRLFYAYPEEPRTVTGNATVEVSVHKNKFELCSLTRSPIFQCRLNSKKGVSSNAMQEDDDDLFGSLRPQKSTGSAAFTMKSVLNLGRDARDFGEVDDPYYGAAMTRSKVQRQQMASALGETDLNSAMEGEYVGPWLNRLAYIAKEVPTQAGKWFFRAMIESKNRLDTLTRLATAGVVLLDVMLIRRSIELTTSAMIAMKAGNETMITTIGHSHVQVTKESRGCWHINVGFFMGIIKIQPNNVALIPHAFPETLVGGKGINFLTNFADLRLPNPARPSLIAVLVGPDEREFDSPLHIINGPTIIRPGIDYAVHLRKHSAGEWLKYALGANNIANIDLANQGRETYATCLAAANTLNQGPASYIDPMTTKRVDMEGSGPMGSFNLNMAGVQDVYEGRAQHFPDRIQMYAYQNS